MVKSQKLFLDFEKVNGQHVNQGGSKPNTNAPYESKFFNGKNNVPQATIKMD